MQYDSIPMKRRLIAAAWIAGSTAPLLVAAVFLFGCCVLPFHGVIHQLVPLCDIAAGVARGDQSADGHEHQAQPPASGPQKQEPVKRFFTRVPETFALAVPASSASAAATRSAADYRSFISLGAVRCDQDVGLHLLVETFLI